MTRTYINVGIYGVGLIGGSLGKALKAYNRKSSNSRYSIYGIGRNIARLKRAKMVGAVDGYTIKPDDVLGKLDILEAIRKEERQGGNPPDIRH